MKLKLRLFCSESLSRLFFAPYSNETDSFQIESGKRGIDLEAFFENAEKIYLDALQDGTLECFLQQLHRRVPSLDSLYHHIDFFLLGSTSNLAHAYSNMKC